VYVPITKQKIFMNKKKIQGTDENYARKNENVSRDGNFEGA
jgi:hypothetical protein